MSGADTVATITRITVENKIRQYRRSLEFSFPHTHEVHELFICGPSARNPNIIDYLTTELPNPVTKRLLDDIGIPADANDAFCYAHLALEAVLGRLTFHADIAETTAEEVVRGEIVPGRIWGQLQHRVLQFSKGSPLYVSRDIVVAGCIPEEGPEPQ
jgi:1,6-anhydro-N-acetylmuramate kinase